MSTALERAARDLSEKLNRYNIRVNHYEIFINDDKINSVEFGTPRTTCRRILKKYITEAEAVEEAEKLKNQEKLL